MTAALEGGDWLPETCSHREYMLCVTNSKLAFVIVSEKWGCLKFAGSAELEEMI